MSKEAIRFYPVTGDPELVAVAEVLLHEKWGVYLRGWHVLSRAGRIEVVPPHRIYRDPASGEERVFPLLHFENEETEKLWVGRVREEYLRWSTKNAAVPLPSLQDAEEIG